MLNVCVCVVSLSPNPFLHLAPSWPRRAAGPSTLFFFTIRLLPVGFLIFIWYCVFTIFLLCFLLYFSNIVFSVIKLLNPPDFQYLRMLLYNHLLQISKNIKLLWISILTYIGMWYLEQLPDYKWCKTSLRGDWTCWVHINVYYYFLYHNTPHTRACPDKGKSTILQNIDVAFVESFVLIFSPYGYNIRLCAKFQKNLMCRLEINCITDSWTEGTVFIGSFRLIPGGTKK